MSTHYTLATAAGPAFVGLVTHVAAGVSGIATGYVALAAAKGGNVHRQFGRVFVYVMLVMALFGAVLAAFEHKIGSVDAGVFAAYFVFTALLAVRPSTPLTSRLVLGGMLLCGAASLVNLGLATQALAEGHMARDGVPVPAYFLFGGIGLLSCAGDWRVLRRGAPSGTARLVRHLWRMCFSLFIAASSFFLGQAHLFPQAYRNYWILSALAFAPMAALLYWLWRIRIRRRLRGLILIGVEAA